MVELVRDLRSSAGYGSGEFATFAIDAGSDIFSAFMNNGKKSFGGYDYVLNLSALKHVRSEKDPYTLMRMVDVNIFNIEKTMGQAKEGGARKYFCVSTDKAANPVNMMGASKRIMEYFLMRRSRDIPVSTARFANVAFSDGASCMGLIANGKRSAFGRPQRREAILCNPERVGQSVCCRPSWGKRDLFFLNSTPIQSRHFLDIAMRYLALRGMSQWNAPPKTRHALAYGIKIQGKWPVFFFPSDTTGEKDYEEFFTPEEVLDLERFESVG